MTRDRLGLRWTGVAPKVMNVIRVRDLVGPRGGFRRQLPHAGNLNTGGKERKGTHT